MSEGGRRSLAHYETCDGGTVGLAEGSKLDGGRVQNMGADHTDVWRKTDVGYGADQVEI